MENSMAVDNLSPVEAYRLGQQSDRELAERMMRRRREIYLLGQEFGRELAEKERLAEKEKDQTVNHRPSAAEH
jgi:hypothetical protein